MTCPARFIKQQLKDPEQNARMKCARPEGHQHRHRNKAGDLTWSKDLEIDLGDLLDEPRAGGDE